MFCSKYKRRIEELEQLAHERLSEINSLQNKLKAETAKVSFFEEISKFEQKTSEKQANFPEKIKSVRGYQCVALKNTSKPFNAVKPITYLSAHEAAECNGIDGSNLTKRLKETGGNCIVKGIQFVLVRI